MSAQNMHQNTKIQTKQQNTNNTHKIHTKLHNIPTKTQNIHKYTQNYTIFTQNHTIYTQNHTIYTQNYTIYTQTTQYTHKYRECTQYTHNTHREYTQYTHNMAKRDTVHRTHTTRTVQTRQNGDVDQHAKTGVCKMYTFGTPQLGHLNK